MLGTGEDCLRLLRSEPEEEELVLRSVSVSSCSSAAAWPFRISRGTGGAIISPFAQAGECREEVEAEKYMENALLAMEPRWLDPAVRGRVAFR